MRNTAAYKTDPTPRRSRLDRLADRAPKSMRLQAGAAALAVDRMVTASQRAKTAVRARPMPYALMAIGAGVVIGLIAYGPSRRAIGGVIASGSRSSLNALAAQLGRELRSLLR